MLDKFNHKLIAYFEARPILFAILAGFWAYQAVDCLRMYWAAANALETVVAEAERITKDAL